MKIPPRLAALLLLAGVAFLLFVSVSRAGVPRIITFQGKLTDSEGVLINEAKTLTFRIYDRESGGTALWEEAHTDVPVTKGIFAVPLGVNTPLTLSFDTNYWVCVQVQGDAEMEPRQRLTSAPYALRADKADHATNADQATSATHATTADSVIQSPIPTGVIVMWSGLIAEIPDGWALCDGGNGTPDLRDRFVVGARQDEGGESKTDVKGALQKTGGEHEHVLTMDEMALHRHPWEYMVETGGTAGNYFQVDPTVAQRFSFTGRRWSDCSNDGFRGKSIGDDQAHENCPPFYALAFIMKL